MDEWWMSFLGDIVWESLHHMKNTNEKGPDDLSHKQNTKLKPSIVFIIKHPQSLYILK